MDSPFCSRHVGPCVSSLPPPQSYRDDDLLWPCGAGLAGDVPVRGLWREHHLPASAEPAPPSRVEPASMGPPRGQPRGPPRSPPRGPPRSPLRGPPRGQPRGPPRGRPSREVDAAPACAQSLLLPRFPPGLTGPGGEAGFLTSLLFCAYLLFHHAALILNSFVRFLETPCPRTNISTSE